MDSKSKIYVAGHMGLVGGALIRILHENGFTNTIGKSHAELDLTDSHAVEAFFEAEKPEYVFLAAAKVGGIMANNTYPAEFIYQNLQIQNNVIHNAWKHGVKKLLFLGSSCIYPKVAPQPIKEEYLLTGSLEPTNEPYAIAKIAGIKMCQSYNRQYGTQFIAGMPTNLYGVGDNFDLQTSHVLPALIRKFDDAKKNNAPSVELWGDGSPLREFLYVDDVARGCLYMMNHFSPTKEQNESGDIFMNIGCGEDISIHDIAQTIQAIVGFTGEIKRDTTKPNGTPRKLLDVSRLFEIGWRPVVSLEEGLQRTYQWYLNM